VGRKSRCENEKGKRDVARARELPACFASPHRSPGDVIDQPHTRTSKTQRHKHTRRTSFPPITYTHQKIQVKTEEEERGEEKGNFINSLVLRALTAL
jgi:hypothetical protein